MTDWIRHNHNKVKAGYEPTNAEALAACKQEAAMSTELPVPAVSSYQVDSTMRSLEIFTYSEDQMRAYGQQCRDADKAEIERLRALLLKSKREHSYCEDTWYSCPKAPEGCSDDMRGPECDCGADEWNARVDAALKERER